MIDTISKREVLDKFQKICDSCGEFEKYNGVTCRSCYFESAIDIVENEPSAQPEPISEEYAKAVRTWLINYQVRCAELKGRYTPYEILGWIVSDWRKENETW